MLQLKKIFMSVVILLCMTTYVFSQSGTRTVTVDSEGNIKYPRNFIEQNKLVNVNNFNVIQNPERTKFINSNRIVSTDVICVFVDTYRDGIYGTGQQVHSYINECTPATWTDCELKVLDKDGKIVYFFSTISFRNKQVQNLHSGILSDNEIENIDNVRVYYYVSGKDVVCASRKKRFTEFNMSIASIEKISGNQQQFDDKMKRITGIQIFPSAKFIDVFLNPDNTIVVWRQNILKGEIDGNGQKLWKPAIIQYYKSTPSF